MAGQGQDQDKTEQPTPFKLREAKNKGQVAKSMEFNSFLMLMVLLGTIVMLSGDMINKTLMTNAAIFNHAHDVRFEIPALLNWMSRVVDNYLLILAPMLLAIIVVAVLMNMFQTGPVFSFHPLKADIQRINPIAGLKRLFSMRLLFESFKSIIKIIVYGAVIYWMLLSKLPVMLLMMNSRPEQYPDVILAFAAQMLIALLSAVFIIAVLDLIYTRWDYTKKMRMSRRELKDEIKRREGDPLIRAKIKQEQKESSRRASSISKVPEADVLITNPTHLAIAIQYRRHECQAPEVIAKGAGDVAKRMKYLARKHNVPIIEDKPLARALFRQAGIGEMVPDDNYAAIARVLVWAYSQKRRFAEKMHPQRVISS